MTNIIKEYLVSLGWKADVAGFDKIKKMMSELERKSKKMPSSARAAILVSSALVTANSAILGYVASLAKADVQNERLARSMWTTKDNAEAMNKTLSALGITLNDLWWSAEQRQRFQQLRREALNLRPPAEFSDQMKRVRDVLFEFSRTKVTLQYAGQWVSYYFLKYIETPLANIKKSLKEFNDSLQLKLPEGTKVVAQVFSWFFRLLSAGITFLSRAGQGIMKFLKGLPPELLLVAAGVAAIAAAFKTGPLGLFVGLLSTALLLYEDFLTWQQGGESMFDWSKPAAALERIIDLFENSTIQESLQSIGESLGEIFRKLVDAAGAVNDFLKEATGMDAVELVFKGIEKIVGNVAMRIEAVAKAIKSVLNLISDGFNPENIETALVDSAKGMISGAFGIDVDEAIAKAKSFIPSKEQISNTLSSWGDKIGGFFGFNGAKETAKASNVTNNRNINAPITQYIYGNDPVGTGTAAANALKSNQFYSGALSSPYS